MASGSEALFAAIEAGDVALVGSLLREDPSLASSRDADGVSALMRARYRSDRGVIDAIRSSIGALDVFEAAAVGDTARIEELVGEDAACAGSVSGDGFTPLHLAAFFGRLGAATALLRHGAEPNARGRGWMIGTPLHSAAAGRHPDIVRALLAAGADPDVRQAGGWTPLHSAAHNGDAASVELLLAAGADVEAVDDAGTSVRSMAEASADEATIALVRAALPT